MAKPCRPVLIQTSLRSSWGSCLTIMPNLEASYVGAFGSELKSVDCGQNLSSVEILMRAKELHALKPTHLIFIDHVKHPLDLLLAMDMVFKEHEWPTLIFHVYGDFTLFTPKWKKAVGVLKGKRVQFVCASDRQRSLIASFVKGGETRTSVCPFPISEDEFGIETGLRERVREEFVKEPGEFLMLYTGRMSLQKNVLRMVWAVATACDEEKIPFRFLLAGSFDDMGSPFFGLRSPPNGYYMGYQQLMADLPAHLRSRVEYVGAFDKMRLKELYNAADLFVSFSTHHDEDYGMSPIEALACGTPALLSDWGGFASFAIDPESVALVPVKIGGTGAVVETTGVREQMRGFYQRASRETFALREERSRRFFSRFGIRKGTEIVLELLGRECPKFTGFTPAMSAHSDLMARLPERGRMFEIGKRTDSNYKTFYRHYVAERMT